MKVFASSEYRCYESSSRFIDNLCKPFELNCQFTLKAAVVLFTLGPEAFLFHTPKPRRNQKASQFHAMEGGWFLHKHVRQVLLIRSHAVN